MVHEIEKNYLLVPHEIPLELLLSIYLMELLVQWSHDALLIQQNVVQLGSLALCLPALLDLHVQLLSQVISLGS